MKMRDIIRLFLLNLTTITVLLFLVAASHGAVVTNTNDTGSGSLRAAIANYSADPNITFNIPANAAGCTGTVCTITVASTLNLTAFSGTPVMINGAGLNTIIISGGNAVRIFNISSGGVNFVLNALTIRNGAVAGNGAGINFDQGNSLTITNSTIRNNAATGNNRQGGGFFRSGGGGPVTITNCTFNDNTANGNNSQGGAFYITGGTNTITNSTFSSNLANGNSGQGGAIYLTNSGPVLSINHSTFTLNSATSNLNNAGGAIYNPPFASTPTIRNTIIAQNTTSGVGPDLNGTYTSGGNNLIGDGTGSVGFVNLVNNDQVGTAITPINAMLDGLTNLLGPTMTHPLMAGSPAIDKAATGLTTDQRGLTRPVDMAVANAPNGSGEDIGAFELQVASAAFVSVSGQVDVRFGGGRTTISMTNTATGETQTTVVNSFGYYRFDEVQAGETYVFQVSNRRYQFAPQVVTILDEIVNLNFSPK